MSGDGDGAWVVMVRTVVRDEHLLLLVNVRLTRPIALGKIGEFS